MSRNQSFSGLRLWPVPLWVKAGPGEEEGEEEEEKRCRQGRPRYSTEQMAVLKGKERRRGETVNGTCCAGVMSPSQPGPPKDDLDPTNRSSQPPNSP